MPIKYWRLDNNAKCKIKSLSFAKQKIGQYLLKRGNSIMKKSEKITQNSRECQNKNIDSLLRNALTPNEKPSQELNAAIIKKAFTQNQKNR